MRAYAKHIPISEGKKIAQKYGYDQVIIYTRKVGEPGGEHMVTFGIDKVHCNIAARIGDFLKHKIMGWRSENE